MSKLEASFGALMMWAMGLGTGCSKEVPPEPTEPARAPMHRTGAAEPPAGPVADLGVIAAPADNPQTAEKVELGRQLFFDQRLSADGSRACYSCHRNEDGTGGHDPRAIGAKNVQLPRHSPVLWNVGYLPRHYWDGRADSLEAQAIGAWAGGNMGVGKENLEAKAQQMAKIQGYAVQFEKVFGGEGATPRTIVKALAAYERTLVCKDTAYDRSTRGDPRALSEAQRRGLALFTGKAACASCHTPPFFSLSYLTKDGAYFNTGVGIEGKPESEVDIGRMAVTKQTSDWAAFKVPTLRNVSRSAPYFHDGSVTTLESAVRFMAHGGFPNKNLTPLLADRKLTDAEIDDLVAFLGALECPGELEAPKTLP